MKVNILREIPWFPTNPGIRIMFESIIALVMPIGRISGRDKFINKYI